MVHGSRTSSAILVLFAVLLLGLASGCVMTVRPTCQRSMHVSIAGASHPVRTSSEPPVRWSRHPDAPADTAGQRPTCVAALNPH
jgi:hypothetical protein